MQEIEETWGEGAWVAQSVKHPTLGFVSGHDLTVCGFETCVGLHTVSMEPAWDSLCPSLSLSAPPLLAFSLSLPLSLSLKINKFKKKKEQHTKLYRSFNEH